MDDGFDVGFAFLEEAVDLVGFAAFGALLSHQEVLDLLKVLLRMLVALGLPVNRLRAQGRIVGTCAALIGQVIFVLLILETQFPLSASVSVARFDTLEAILYLPHYLLQVICLQLLIELLNAVFDNRVQLDGLVLRDWQVAHELCARDPVGLLLVLFFFRSEPLVFMFLLISFVDICVASQRLALDLVVLCTLLRAPRSLVALPSFHPLLLDLGVQIVKG